MGPNSLMVVYVDPLGKSSKIEGSGLRVARPVQGLGLIAQMHGQIRVQGFRVMDPKEPPQNVTSR